MVGARADEHPVWHRTAPTTKNFAAPVSTVLGLRALVQMKQDRFSWVLGAWEVRTGDSRGAAAMGGLLFKLVFLLCLKYSIVVFASEKNHTYNQSPQLPASSGYNEQLGKAMFQIDQDDLR